MNVREAMQWIGKKVEVPTQYGEVTFTAEVIDVKTAFGRTDLQVRPVSGRGTASVDATRVRVVRS